MAQTGYTPILIYSSSTVSQAPSAGNLTNSTLGSELAINITDGKLFYKDNANAVQVIAWKTTPTTAGGTGLTSYTAGDLLYYATGTTLAKLTIGASTTVLTSSGTAPQWTAQSALSVGEAANLKSNATTGVMQITGPAAATTRVMTIPNANFTAARTDASQTFTGDQTFTNNVFARTFQSTTSAAVVNPSGAVFGFYSSGGTAQTVIQMPNTGNIAIWKPDTSEAARFHNSGGVSIGNTTDPGAANLSVSGNGLFGTTTASARLTTQSSTATSGSEAFWATNGSVRLFSVRGDGLMYTGTAAASPYNNSVATAANMVVTSTGEVQRSTSSLKYKKNVQNATHGLADVLKLRAVTYQGSSERDTEQILGGLIAEEVDAAGLSEFVQYADDGTPDALAYGNMVSLAFKAIQELAAQNEQLKQRITALESK